MGLPLVSVVIPTSNRTDYLSDAIDSALFGLGSEVEVIVVPNGPSSKWREPMARFERDARVKIAPISPANANIARNHGLDLANGQLIRFLDDDDFLYPAAALDQYHVAQSTMADLVSGNVNFIDGNGRSFAKRSQPETSDFCEGTLGSKRICLPHLHVYRRNSIGNTRWNPATAIRQDVEWQLDLCASREWEWAKSDYMVGVWRHHWGSRISKSQGRNSIRSATVEMLLRTYQTLLSDGRMTDARRQATAEGLWSLIHGAFFLEPRFWSSVAEIASTIDPESRPSVAAFNYPILRMAPPLLLEAATLPIRWSYHALRTTLSRAKILPYW